MDLFNKNTQTTSIFHLHIHFIFFLLISLPPFLVVSQGCHQDERRALLGFKSSIQDPSNRLSSWQEGIQYQNCCSWNGIKCSMESFRVISINLRNSEYEIYLNQYYNYYNRNLSYSPPKTSLQGKFSPYLYNFTHLQYLDLAFNDFQKSQIPLEFSTLTKLTHLDLSKSNFSGSISTQLANLSFLKYLDLSCDLYSDYFLQYLSSTKWLRGLVNLQVLRLGGIDLTSQTDLAEHISFLSNLEDLDLSYCGISGPVFPIQEFNNLSRLSSLSLWYNTELNSPFPVHLANLTSLSSLNLSSCNLHGSVPYMPQLKVLNVGQNTDLHVHLTRMFEHKWPKLQLLDITETKVTGLFQSLTSNVLLLESLDASGCSIQGTLPKSICKLSNLQDLILNDNNFTGTIPNCITMLRYLNRFEIRNNSIGGVVSLSSFIGKLNLTTLDLSSNNLMVATDQHLHLYPKLKLMKLMLKSCNLNGLFPAFICSFTNLGGLDFSLNNLTGTIPSCIHKLKYLILIDLSHNNLHGPLPLPAQNVMFYSLAHNKFNGEISVEIGRRLSTALWIFLSNNQLTGSVPFSLCSKEAGNVQYLDLSNNKLSGIIPTTIRYCTSLEYLNLGTNNLTGNVPKGREQAKDLEFLLLNDNNLHGTPLHLIGKLHELKVLSLGNNNFEGSISSLSGSNLWILSLRSNNFNGSIPLIDLHELQILDLSGNKFTGLISMKISNLTMLISRHNNSGRIRSNYDVQLKMASKGLILQFEKLYYYSSGIDLSSNMLEGEISEEMGLLKGLSMLNLSHNRLSGQIPLSIGSMDGLESLDLSFNKLSGLIPPSIASMDFLSVLNLSYNNLSGRIPRGPHIDTLGGDGSAYVNNSFLCGYLMKNACWDDQSRDTGHTDTLDEDGQDDTRDKWYFYGVVYLVFIVGFWGLFFGLLLKKEKWWFGYWRAVDTVAVKIVELYIRD